MRSAVVTGAAGGIGRAICTTLSEAGFRVIGLDCREETGLPYEVLPFDVRDFAEGGSSCADICSPASTAAVRATASVRRSSRTTNWMMPPLHRKSLRSETVSTPLRPRSLRVAFTPLGSSLLR